MEGETPACDVDRSWPYLRNSFVSKARTVDALDRNMGSNVRRQRRETHPLRYSDDPHPATTPATLAAIPEACGFTAADRARQRSCRIGHPARAELPGSGDELHPHCWTAHSTPYGGFRTSLPHRAICDRSQGEFEFKPNFSYFDGESYNEDYLSWEQEVDSYFSNTNFPQDRQARYVVCKLTGRAKTWWALMLQARHLEGRSEVRSWRKMKSLLRSQFLTSDYKLLSDEAKPSVVMEKIEKQRVDVYAKGMDIDVQLSPGERDAKVKSHSRKLLEVDKPVALSTKGWFLSCEAKSEPMSFVDGCGDDQRLETDVDAESMVGTDEDSIAMSIASGAPEDARLGGSLILRKGLAKLHIQINGSQAPELESNTETDIPSDDSLQYDQRREISRLSEMDAKSCATCYQGRICPNERRFLVPYRSGSTGLEQYFITTMEDSDMLQNGENLLEDPPEQVKISKKNTSLRMEDLQKSESASSLETTASSQSGSSTVDEIEPNLVTVSEIRWEGVVLGMEIGEGTFGVVYHGIWIGLDVAIKEYTRMDYKKEIAIMKKLRHPNLLLFLGAVYSPERLAIVTNANVDFLCIQGWQITFPPKPGWSYKDLMIQCDIPEVIGKAFALIMLFRVPIWCGVLATGLSTLLLPVLQQYGVRKLELLIACLVLTMDACFFAELRYAKPQYSEILKGLFVSPN